MKISEVIKQLQSVQHMMGDLEVYTTDDHSLHDEPSNPVYMIQVVDDRVIFIDRVAKR